VIRGAVLHFSNEQPLVCDLRSLPVAADSCIVITRLRFVDGRKPTFIDHDDSWFVFPLANLRFIEIPAEAITGESDEPRGLPSGEPQPVQLVAGDRLDLEEADDALAGDDLLRRIREA
jgi:hypothetical protein